MLEIRDIQRVPYINGPSNEYGQQPFMWVKNNENATGVPIGVLYDPQGTINRVPAQLLENTIIIDDNVKQVREDLVDVVVRVNSHETILGELGDTSLAQAVSELKDQVDTYTFRIEELENFKSDSLGQIEDLDTRVGYRVEEDQTERNVFEDLLWIKGSIGNYSGFDVNGDAIEGAQASGVKAFIESHAQTLSSHNARLESIESGEQFSQYAEEINSLRSEIGPSNQATPQTVYVRLNTIGQDIQQLNETVDNLVIEVGNSEEGLIYNLSQTQDELNELSGNLSLAQQSIDIINTQLLDSETEGTVASRIDSVEQGLSTVLEDLPDVSERLSSIEQVVGDTESGLVLSVNNIAGTVNTNSDDINTLQSQLGNNTPGDESGLFLELSSINESISGITHSVGITLNEDSPSTDLDIEGQSEQLDLGSYIAFNSNNGGTVLSDGTLLCSDFNGRYIGHLSVFAEVVSTGDFVEFVVVRNDSMESQLSMTAPIVNGHAHLSVSVPLTIQPDQEFHIEAKLPDGTGSIIIKKLRFFISK